MMNTSFLLVPKPGTPTQQKILKCHNVLLCVAQNANKDGMSASIVLYKQNTSQTNNNVNGTFSNVTMTQLSQYN